MEAGVSSSDNKQTTLNTFLSIWKEQSIPGIVSLIVAIIATIAAVRAMMYVNYGTPTPTDVTISTLSTYMSIGFPFISILLGWWGMNEKKEGNLFSIIGIGISLFILSTVGFAYLLSALF